MWRRIHAAIVFTSLSVGLVPASEVEPPNNGRGAGTIPVWNPHRPAAGNAPITVRVLVLNYDPLVPSEGGRRLSEVFGWNNPAKLAVEYKEAMEYACGGYVTFEIVEWRNLNEIYAQEGGHRYTVAEYVRNRRTNKGWREHGMADYPRLLHEQNVAPLVDDGVVDEVWIFSDHFFGLWEASMAGPGAFFINGGVYPQFPTKRPFAFYGFNYERGVAEMMHDASHRTEATLNRVYGQWNLKSPANHWEKFSANHDQSSGLAGVGTCHWPANATGDYDYSNPREVSSWADAFLTYPMLDLVRKPVSRATWSKGPDYHLDYMKWYFAHLPRAAGVNADGRQNNWLKCVFDFQNYDDKGRPLPASAEFYRRDVADPSAATHTLHIAYSSADLIDAESLDDEDLIVQDPNGATLTVKLVGGNEPANRTYRVGLYEVAAPSDSWGDAPDGDFVVTLKADQVRLGDGRRLPGKPLGSFRVLRGEGSSLAQVEDGDVMLLARFDGTTAGGKNAKANLERNLKYETALANQGVYFGPGSVLQYPVKDVLDPKEGTVEFWIKPSWHGDSGKSRVFFQAGRGFDNGMLVQVDGANNLRFQLWGDDPETPAMEKSVERGDGISAARSKAGEWHHIAVTWSEGGRRFALYVDGQLAHSNDNGVVISEFSQPEFWIGSAEQGSAPSEALFDELRISRRARSAREIRASAAPRGVDSLTINAPTKPLLVAERAVIRAIGRTKSGLRSEVTRNAVWTSSDANVVQVDGDGNLTPLRPGIADVAVRLGNVTATAPITVVNSGLPQAALLEAKDAAKGTSDPVAIVVAYEDADGVRRDSLGKGDIRVSGPNGFVHFPEPAEIQPGRRNGRLTAKYLVHPPAGKWRSQDNGEYTIELKAFQVADAKQRHAPETVLGSFRVRVPR